MNKSYVGLLLVPIELYSPFLPLPPPFPSSGFDLIRRKYLSIPYKPRPEEPVQGRLIGKGPEKSIGTDKRTR